MKTETEIKDMARTRMLISHKKGELPLACVNVYFDAFVEGYSAAIAHQKLKEHKSSAITPEKLDKLDKEIDKLLDND